MDRKTYLHHFAAQLTAMEPLDFYGLGHPDNPANIHSLLSMEAAIQQMYAAGATEAFCDPMTWANNSINVPVMSLSVCRPG